MRPLLATAAVLSLGLSAPGAAETLYVTDRLQAGLHAGQTLESPVLALLGSGTALEVLESDGVLARVRTPEGTEGWVDARLLAVDVATRQLAELEARHRALEAQVAAADAAAAEPAPAPAPALDKELASERLRAGELEKRLAEAERAARRLTEVEAENTRLADTLARAQGGQPAPAPETAPAWLDWRLAAALAPMLLLGGFGVGAWYVDWRARRRHGGFRV